MSTVGLLSLVQYNSKYLLGPILSPVTLIDLQVTALASVYLSGTSAPHGGWLLAGIGLRFAQDTGAHREKVLLQLNATPPTADIGFFRSIANTILSKIRCGSGFSGERSYTPARFASPRVTLCR